ncbi:MAG: hypothetical protein ABW157_10380 [Candidatus Thiodiazotropha sp. LLP2]
MSIIRYHSKVIWILFCVLLSSPLLAEQKQAELLQYQVKEADQEPYLSRIFVTPLMMRIDQGEDADGFILYDRRQSVIYSVDYEERTILVIESKPQKDTSMVSPPKVTTQALVVKDAPMVAGQKPQHWRMLVNGQSCQEALTVSGVMMESLAAQKEYLQLLAEQHKVSLGAIPMTYRDACADAMQVYAPTILWDKGLPLRIWDINNNQQILIDFSQSEPISEEQFNLPDDFERVPMH